MCGIGYRSIQARSSVLAGELSDDRGDDGTGCRDLDPTENVAFRITEAT